MIEIINKRNSTVELLRCLFMYLIMVHHVFVHGVDHYKDIFSLPQDPSNWPSFELFLLGKGGVVGFIFISGFYGINYNIKKILCFFLNICFYLLILQFLLGHGLNQILAGLVHPYDTWWFVRDYLVLLVISPLLNEGWKRLNNQTKTCMIICLIYIFCIGQARYDSHDVMVMIVVYLLGKYVREYTELNKNMTIYIYVLSLICLTIYCLIPLLLSLYGLDSYTSGWVSHNNIFLITAIGGCILYANNNPFHNRGLNILSKHLLAIYLITDYPSFWHFHKALLPMMFDFPGYFICFVTCLVCIFVDSIKSQLFAIGTRLICHDK